MSFKNLQLNKFVKSLFSWRLSKDMELWFLQKIRFPFVIQLYKLFVIQLYKLFTLTEYYFPKEENFIYMFFIRVFLHW